MSSQAATPLMRQYLQLKQEHPDAFLFFRVGDFYELFFEDAVEAAPLLQITLTSRDKNSPSPIPLCGVPVHSISGYIAKLVAAGRSVALCEQIGGGGVPRAKTSGAEINGPEAKGALLQREIVRVITPGTVFEPDLLKPGVNNFLAAVVPPAIAYIDLSTSDFRLLILPQGGEIVSEIERIAPKEIILSSEFESLSRRLSGKVTLRPDEIFDLRNADRLLCAHFAVPSPAPLGLANQSEGVRAVGALLAYLTETQKEAVSTIRSINLESAEGSMALDSATLRHLEILESEPGGKSLLATIDRTRTAMGARLLREWLSRPLTDPRKIGGRLDAVSAFAEENPLRERVRKTLSSMPDLERLVSRTAFGAAGPRDLAALLAGLSLLPEIGKAFGGAPPLNSSLIADLAQKWDSIEEIASDIGRTLADEPPPSLDQGGVIREGISTELDQARALASDARSVLARMEREERVRTGIDSLKIRHNQVFGYYIEVTRPNLKKVPSDFTRKQTTATGERFITADLKELESKIFSAQETILRLEKEIFKGLCGRVAVQAERVRAAARRVARIDLLSSLAETALFHRYVRPEVNNGQELKIVAGRHPVLEQLRTKDPFVPNDLLFDAKEQRLWIITGPNMAGKSTFMRQNALIVLLAQAGSFVPAKEAVIGVADRIFARVGARDNLAAGESTFMVEMTETAAILRNASSRSLVLLDEIGRGTSTYDGVAIACAVAERLATIGARTLFATHYHELTGLESHIPGVKNVHAAVREWGDEVIFLRKIVPGGTDRSYGVQVARLAGIPQEVIDRAREVLARLEGGELRRPIFASEGQLGLFSAPEAEPLGTPIEARGPARSKDPNAGIVSELRALDILNLTPIEAQQRLAELKEKADRAEGTS